MIKIWEYNLINLDTAVIGSGIGGSLTASLYAQNSQKSVTLFEKDKNLGGCASTFKRFGNRYNTGATTLVGYENGHIIKKQFDAINLKPNISKNDLAMCVVQNGKVTNRVKDLEVFLEIINKNYPNKNNQLFWKKIKEIDEKFWKLKHIYFAKYGIKQYLKTAFFIAELLKVYGLDIFKSADSYIKNSLGDISQEYKNFIDSQLLITIQTTSKDISLLSLALGLSYPFHDVFYVNGGMGNLIEDIVKDIEVKKDEEILKISQDTNGWIFQTKKGEYKTEKLVLNSSVYQNAQLFKDDKIKKYYNQFEFSDQSAFVLYLSLDTNEEFLEHYQFIYDELLPNSISNSFFVSFSKQNDPILSKKGLSVTISTHTKARYWTALSKERYEQEKLKTEEFIMQKFLEYFTTISKQNVVQCFSSTSSTFQRYIGRTNCGGKAIHMKNIAQLPSCNTPFKGLYNVGDTVFAGQGWPGVALGVDVLLKELHASS